MREISCARELQVGANLGQCLATPEELWREGSIRTGEVKSHFFYIKPFPFTPSNIGSTQHVEKNKALLLLIIRLHTGAIARY